MDIKRSSSVEWKGGLKSGVGSVSLESGALKDYPYGFNSRFGAIKGTNPEELIAAAHAACFTMFLSDVLEKAGHVAEKLETKALVNLCVDEKGIDITTSHLILNAKVPGLDQASFDKIVKEAKEGCPVSKVLKAEISIEAKLVTL